MHDGWGLGGFSHMSSALAETVLQAQKEDPTVITAWIRMFFRYYFNWVYERYDYSGGREAPPRDRASEPRVAQAAFRGTLLAADTVLRALKPVVRAAADLAEPLTRYANPAMKALLPLVEALVRGMVKMEPVTGPLSERMVDFVRRADPGVFA